MELRAYGTILMRRLWIILLVVGLAALYAGFQFYHLIQTPGALKAYQSQITVRIGIQASTQQNGASYGDLITAAETFADELAKGPVMTSPVFASQIKQQLEADRQQKAVGGPPDVGAIARSITVSNFHSVVTVTVNWSTPAGAQAIARAVGEVMQHHIGDYLDYEIRGNNAANAKNKHAQPSAQIVNDATEPVQVEGFAGNKPLLLVALVLVALIIGVALAFLMEYLDDRVRSKEEVERLLQLPVIAELPRIPVPGKEKR
uniref:Polysaccharide chain length determinant N-terminal domain-containing protein n=1 Tax=Thermosporothrix sp. COM3 TaxID=2490863 RepID=A0A455STG2_9CHLR|nr:hypothetical protein KTC_57510 [Thermosporothrix sp. COM3]